MRELIAFTKMAAVVDTIVVFISMILLFAGKETTDICFISIIIGLAFATAAKAGEVTINE